VQHCASLRGGIVRKKAGMNGFDKELYVATVATATIIINYANDD